MALARGSNHGREGLAPRFAWQPALGPGRAFEYFEYFSRIIPIRGPTARAGYDNSILRWQFGSFWIGMLDLHIDSAGQLTVQPHLLHFTTQNVGTASALVTPAIIGKYMPNVMLGQQRGHVRQICPSIRPASKSWSLFVGCARRRSSE
jgi:hypothetical protein